MNPALSIITIDYNNRDGLQKTIDSVVAQSFRDFEWIVIDGGPLMVLNKCLCWSTLLLTQSNGKKVAIALGCGNGECANRILKAVDYSAMRDSNAPLATIKDFVTVNCRDVVADVSRYQVGENHISYAAIEYGGTLSREICIPT